MICLVRKTRCMRDYIIFSKTNNDKPLNTYSNMITCQWKRTGGIKEIFGREGRACEDENAYRKMILKRDKEK